MLNLSLTTPALLFSAVSLILLAYTNRFLAYAQIIRNLYADYNKSKTNIIAGQIKNLRKRLNLIRLMQILGVTSLFLSMGAMLFLYFNIKVLGELNFVLSLLCMIVSLALSIWEIQISVVSLNLHLKGMEKEL
jgi:hypothetical protein